MGYYLNSTRALALYKNEFESIYYIDKSLFIEELFPLIKSGNKHICITRPRRFGKSVMASMVAAFFSKGMDSSLVFDTLKIAQSPFYRQYLNQQNVIFINFSEAANLSKNYDTFISRIERTLKRDLRKAFPKVDFWEDSSSVEDLRLIHEETGANFLFVLDEWDCIFHKKYTTKSDQESFISFLAALTKDTGYISLTYMTGVLPIAKYSSGSTINHFMEYTMATQAKYSEYFGFTDQEVDELFGRYLKKEEYPQIERLDLSSWYDGYHTLSGVKMYNPRSVVYALSNNRIANYWTSSGPYSEIADYIITDVDDIKGSVLLMISGESVKADIVEYAATAMKLSTKDEILSAMVVYGFLDFQNGFVRIPNRELLAEFQQTVSTAPVLQPMREIEQASLQLLQATLDGDADLVAERLGYIHATDSPHRVFNTEAELSAAVKIAYLAARERYEIEQEEQAGAGYADFIFFPRNGRDDGIILELKVGKSPEEALRQIKEKNYPLRFRGRIGEPPKTTGRIILVGVNCPRGSREHQCRIEVMENLE